MYEYKIKEIKSIYDGDTLIVVVDLGFGVFKLEKIRLSGIDTPELRGEEHDMGIKARDYLRGILFSAMADEKEVLIKTFKDRKGKYGRYLGEIFINGESVNKMLVDAGHAKIYLQ